MKIDYYLICVKEHDCLTIHQKYFGEETVVYDPNTFSPICYIVVRCDDGHYRKFKKDDYFVDVDIYRDEKLKLLGL